MQTVTRQDFIKAWGTRIIRANFRKADYPDGIPLAHVVRALGCPAFAERWPSDVSRAFCAAMGDVGDWYGDVTRVWRGHWQALDRCTDADTYNAQNTLRVNAIETVAAMLEKETGHV